jgi:hypothetical protein
MMTLDDYHADHQRDWRNVQDQTARERKRQLEVDEQAGLKTLDQRMLTASGQIPAEQPEPEADPAATETAQEANAEPVNLEAKPDINLTPPKAAKQNAQKVLKWREDHPDEIDGMTATGWTRARQLADGGDLTPETVKRMASFARHRKNGVLKAKNKGKPWTQAGYVAWLGWGGTEGVDWAIRKSAELNRH